MTSKLKAAKKILTRVREETRGAGGAVADVGKMVHERRRGEKVDLDDWQRLNKGARPIAKTAGIIAAMEKTAIGYREAMAAGLTAGAIYGGHDRWDRSTQKASENDRRFKYRRLRNTLTGAAGGGLAGAGLVMTGREILNALKKNPS